MRTATLLSLRNVGKSYCRYDSEWQRVARWFGARIQPSEEHWVLREIGFELRAGESLGVVGRNGAGKSTLLKMITGTVQPTAGEIRLQGPGRIAAILELGMGFNPEFTGRRNARHTLELMGIERARIAAALPEIAAFADIGDYFDQPVRTYSTGMQARVAFAAVTAFRPDLLIVDEVLTVGDAHFQAKCFERIARYREQGTTLILVTHAIADVIAQCDRAILLRNGQLAADGTPAHVTNLYFDDLFGKGRATPPRETEPAPASPDFAGDGRELFHTRRGYRKEEHRWGEGGALILDYRISADGSADPPLIESGATTEFAFKVRFERDCETVTPGLLIKTLDGIFVYGANSLSVQADRPPALSARAGDLKVYRFTLPLSLNEGDYLISFGVSAGDPRHALTPLERRYDAVIIHVGRASPFWGLVDLGATLDVAGAPPA